MFLDVRDHDEWKIEHIKDALHIPLSEILSEKIPEVPLDTHLKVFCESGARASIAILILKEKGFTNLENIGSIRNI